MRRQTRAWAGMALAWTMAALSARADLPVAGELAGRVVKQWTFDRDGDFQGWTPNAEVRGAAVRGGALRGTACGNDPIFLGPVCELPATTLQWVEITFRCTAPAQAELFWTETLQGRFGGFSASKHHLLAVLGDGQDHVYRVWPFWQAAKKIIRLRFDPPDDGQFAIRAIRVLQAETPAAGKQQAWTAAEMRQSWHALRQGADSTQPPIALSPPLAIDADRHPFVSVRLATDRPGSGHVYAVSQGHFGWDTLTFPLRADGQMHTYNLDASALKAWEGTICLLGLQVPGGAGTRVESIAVSPTPTGPAEVQIGYFGAREGVNRCGKPVGVTCAVRNFGGTPAEPVVATLHVPPGVKLLAGAQQTVARLSLGLPTALSWQVQADRPGPIALSVDVLGGGSATAAATTIELTAPPAIPPADYVPRPQPVACKYELGAYYFPGWNTAERWEPIGAYPERKPVLGWYDEANPECADWQIKWAVEHGIRFFMVDWYWIRGNRHLDHWVHQAFPKARYRSYLKWAVMWANHNPPHTHSIDDWKQVTRYWIDHYFGTPEYYRIEDRPAVFLWSPDNVRNDLGSSAEAAKLYALSQEMARAAGYKGITFVAVNGNHSAAAVAALAKEGFRGLTSYHTFEWAAHRAASSYFPFSAVVDSSQEVWQQFDQRAAGLFTLPVVDTGWDPRPWHGDQTTVVLDRTPQNFGAVCRLARQYADQTGKRMLAIGPWNEWGEGSYIEPCTGRGFADLDALRAAFCEPGNWPPNVVPADVGRGPYDLPPALVKTAWEFNTDGDLEGWTANSEVGDLAVCEGQLRGRSLGWDPQLTHTGLRIEADHLRHAVFRLRCDRPGQAQLYWATQTRKVNAQAMINVDVPGDEQYHEYRIDLGQNPHWVGIVTTFRLDPAVKPQTRFALDFLRLE